jgi:hypothetical protein
MDVVGFNPRDAEMLINNAEREKVDGFPNAKNDHETPRSAIVYCSAAATARSGTTLGTGSGIAQQISSSGVISDWLNPSGGTLSINFRNPFSFEMSGYIRVHREWFSGVWLADYSLNCLPVVEVKFVGSMMKYVQCGGNEEEVIDTDNECPTPP